MEDPAYRKFLDEWEDGQWFIPAPVDYIEVDRTDVVRGSLEPDEVKEWMQGGGKFASDEEGGRKFPKLRLLIGLKQNPFEEGNNNTLVPFTVGDFEWIMDYWNLPKSVGRVDDTGTCLSVHVQRPPGKGVVIGVLCALEPTWPKDVSLAMSYDVDTDTVRGVMFGRYPGPENVMNIVTNYLSKFPVDANHVVVLSLALFELNIYYEGRYAESRMRRIYDLERKAGFDIWSEEDDNTLQPEQDYGTATKRLSGLVASCLELQSRIKITQGFLNDTKKVLATIEEHAQEPLKQDIRQSAQVVVGYVDLMVSIAEEKVMRIGAAIRRGELFLSMLSALVTQQIGDDTRRDGSAMKTIAILTLVFLPGTAIASLFSMSMFNWGLDPDEKGGVSHWFWIYWVVTVPLTILIFAVWLIQTNPFDNSDTWHAIKRKYRNRRLFRSTSKAWKTFKDEVKSDSEKGSVQESGDQA